jgi:tetratricopeptide (TPR) repeat protein
MKRPVQDKIDELLIRMQYPQAEMVFEFLSQDEAANLQGEQQLLQSIVVETLQKGNYKEAVDKLGDFLRTHHEIKVESRARFYLGQACFFRGQYHEALIEFVFSQELYYNETQAWIDACLEKTDSEK